MTQTTASPGPALAHISIRRVAPPGGGGYHLGRICGLPWLRQRASCLLPPGTTLRRADRVSKPSMVVGRQGSLVGSGGPALIHRMAARPESPTAETRNHPSDTLAPAELESRDVGRPPLATCARGRSASSRSPSAAPPSPPRGWPASGPSPCSGSSCSPRGRSSWSTPCARATRTPPRATPGPSSRSSRGCSCSRFPRWC